MARARRPSVGPMAFWPRRGGRGRINCEVGSRDAPEVLLHPLSELSEEVLHHRRAVLLLGELVAAEAVEAVHLVPGQPEAAVLGGHLGVQRWAGLVSLGVVCLPSTSMTARWRSLKSKRKS